MKRPTARPKADENQTLAWRLIAAVVAVLFFAPLLTLVWLLCNLQFGWIANTWLPGKVLLSAIAVSALLGFVLPQATPTVFGWCAEAFHRLARLWWR